MWDKITYAWSWVHPFYLKWSLGNTTLPLKSTGTIYKISRIAQPFRDGKPWVVHFKFGVFFTRGQLWPSGIVVACVCLCVCVCMCVCVSVNHQFVRTITCHPLKLQSPNLDQKCKRPWLRSLLFLGFIDLDLQGQIELKSQNLPHFGLESLSGQ